MTCYRTHICCTANREPEVEALLERVVPAIGADVLALGIPELAGVCLGGGYGRGEGGVCAGPDGVPRLFNDLDFFVFSSGAGRRRKREIDRAVEPVARRWTRALGIDVDFGPVKNTGDLGRVGKSIVLDLFRRDGVTLDAVYDDCGTLIYDLQKQDVHAGGSGCGCSGVVLSSAAHGPEAADPSSLLRHRRAPLPHLDPAGRVHPRRVPCGVHLQRGGALMEYLRAFLLGGALCAVAQVLIDKTRLTPARILVSLVVIGVFLQAIGVYQPLVDYAGAGATVPLLGFGYSLAKGVAKAVAEQGALGILTGGVTGAAGGIAAAIVFGCLFALLSRPKSKS